jgi:hypothetical protein
LTVGQQTLAPLFKFRPGQVRHRYLLFRWLGCSQEAVASLIRSGDEWSLRRVRRGPREREQPEWGQRERGRRERV